MLVVVGGRCLSGGDEELLLTTDGKEFTHADTSENSIASKIYPLTTTMVLVASGAENNVYECQRHTILSAKIFLVEARLKLDL